VSVDTPSQHIRPRLSFVYSRRYNNMDWSASAGCTALNLGSASCGGARFSRCPASQQFANTMVAVQQEPVTFALAVVF
jgi:hypothetical protein